MKLAIFNDYRPGLVKDDHMLDLSEVVGESIMGSHPLDRMAALIAGFDQLRPKIEVVSGAGIPRKDVQLRAPDPRPQKMLFAQGNYFENQDTPALPLNMFFKLPSAILDSG